jgi:hypothetical protein
MHILLLRNMSGFENICPHKPSAKAGLKGRSEKFASTKRPQEAGYQLVESAD